jgi:hypothetical protein
MLDTIALVLEGVPAGVGQGCPFPRPDQGHLDADCCESRVTPERVVGLAGDTSRLRFE